MQANSFFKKMQGILVSGMSVALCAVLVAGCNSKDDEPEPEPKPEEPVKNEKTSLLKSLSFDYDKQSGFSIDYYPDKIDKIKAINCENGAVVTFDVPNQPKEGDAGKIIYSHEGKETQVSLKFNTLGYVSHAECIESDGTTQTWDFDYNKDGYLIHFKRSLDNTDVNFIYENGDIIKLSVKSDKKETDREAIITYFIEKNTPEFFINNEGNYSFMLYDWWYCIDLGVMNYAVFDKLLGRFTKHLPESYTDNDVFGKRKYVKSNTFPEDLTYYFGYNYNKEENTVTYDERIYIENIEKEI